MRGRKSSQIEDATSPSSPGSLFRFGEYGLLPFACRTIPTIVSITLHPSLPPTGLSARSTVAASEWDEEAEGDLESGVEQGGVAS